MTHSKLNYIYILLIVILSTGLNSYAADRYSVASGNWNSTSTWSATSGGAAGASIPGAGDDVFIENGHTVTVTEDASVLSITFTGVAATLVVNEGYTLSVTFTITLDNQASASSECLLSGGGTVTCNNIINGSGTATPTGGEVTFTHTFISTVSFLNVFVDLSLNSYYRSSSKTSGNAVFYLGSGTLLVGGSIIVQNQRVQNYTTFSMAYGDNDGILLLTGSLPFDLPNQVTSYSIILNGTSALVNYSGTLNQELHNTDYRYLILSGSGTKTSPNKGVILVNDTLSMEGSATYAGKDPTYGTNAALQYMGSVAQATGVELLTTFSASGGVIINNPDGVTLNGSRTISSLLAFEDGILTTGANTLTITSTGTVSGADDNKYVNGILVKGIAASTTSKTFEIGDNSGYTPVNISFAGTTNGTGSLTATTTSGDHPQIGTSVIDPTQSVNRYWTLVNNGVTGFTSYNAVFNFNSVDLDPGLDPLTLAAGLYSLATWSYPVVGTKTSTSLQVTGLNAFGDYQLGCALVSFRTLQSGDWENPGSWEIFSGGAWTTSTSTPSFANNDITIRNTHTITITTPVTIDQFTVDAGGSLVLTDNMTVNDGTGIDFTLSGILECTGSFILAGTGSFLMNPLSSLYIGSPDGISASGSTGSIQTATRTFDPGASYTYNGLSAQVTGDGLPSEVEYLAVDNSSGVTLTAAVAITANLTLDSGELNIGSATLTFLESDTPITKVSGSLTTSDLSTIAFGDALRTGGGAFAFPPATFTSDPSVGYMSIYRSAGITLNEQLFSVAGILLCNGPLETGGNLVLLSSPAGTALIDGTGTAGITGSVTMQRYLGSGFGYKYFSSPFQSATVSEFGDDMDLGASFPAVYRYDESRISSGWVSYNTPANVLNPLQGYIFNFGALSDPNTVDVTGEVNNGNLSVALFNNDNTYTKGMNLVGNPYPSPIDWDAAPGWTKTNIDDAIYYFKASTTDQYGGTYSSYINGISSDGSATNIIPSMQGFFVHVTDGAYPVAGSLGMDNSVRVNDLTHPFLKSKSSEISSVLRLTAAFTGRPESADPAVIYMDDRATEGFDGSLDALKLLNTDFSIPNLYFTTPDSRRLSVNAIPAIDYNTITIPLGVKVNIDGTLVFKLRDIGDDFTGMEISLTDMIAGVDSDLTGGKDYSIPLSSGEYLGRFFLKVGNMATGINENPEAPGMFTIYSSDGILKVTINAEPFTEGRLEIYGLTGNIIFSTAIYSSGYHEFNPGLGNGIYIATFRSSGFNTTKKIIINRR